MFDIYVTEYAEDNCVQFQERLSPKGKHLLTACTTEIVRKLQDPVCRRIPSPTFPSTFVVEALGLWFAWYQVTDDNSILILQFLPRGNVPHVDIIQSRT